MTSRTGVPMSQWTKTVLDSIDTVVETSTNKVVKPAHKIAKVTVYGLVITTLLVMVLFFLVIAAFRGTVIGVGVWGAYLIWGGIFFAVGALLWAKK